MSHFYQVFNHSLKLRNPHSLFLNLIRQSLIFNLFLARSFYFRYRLFLYCWLTFTKKSWSIVFSTIMKLRDRILLFNFYVLTFRFVITPSSFLLTYHYFALVIYIWLKSSNYWVSFTYQRVNWFSKIILSFVNLFTFSFTF